MDKIFNGKIWKFGNDIDTDTIIPGRRGTIPDIQEMKKYAFELLKPEFGSTVQPGDILVAGTNFGCGSSREQAPEVIKALGIRCVIAGSYARIFFRNAINNGLLLIENADLVKDVREGEEITVRAGDSILYKDKTYPISPLPQNLLDILEAGGLVKAMQRLNGKD